MISRLKALLETALPPSHKSSADDDVRLATAALLVRAATIDGHFDEAERTSLHDLLTRRFALSPDAVDDLVAQAEQSERDAVDLYRFTRVVNAGLDRKGKAELVACLWEIVMADGVVDRFEDNLVYRVAGLLHVETRERVLLRREVADRLGLER